MKTSKFIPFGDWAVITINGDTIYAPPSDDLITQAAISGMVYFKYFIVRVPESKFSEYTIGRCPANYPITRVLVASRQPIDSENPQTLPMIKLCLFGTK